MLVTIPTFKYLESTMPAEDGAKPEELPGIAQQGTVLICTTTVAV